MTMALFKKSIIIIYLFEVMGVMGVIGELILHPAHSHPHLQGLRSISPESLASRSPLPIAMILSKAIGF